jgi:hypothetical protein
VLSSVTIDFHFSFQGTYEPGKRHWLKVKKDYLADGAMADTADLVVLGAYFGSGSKGTSVIHPELPGVASLRQTTDPTWLGQRIEN